MFCPGILSRLGITFQEEVISQGKKVKRSASIWVIATSSLTRRALRIYLPEIVHRGCIRVA